MTTLKERLTDAIAAAPGAITASVDAESKTATIVADDIAEAIQPVVEQQIREEVEAAVTEQIKKATKPRPRRRISIREQLREAYIAGWNERLGPDAKASGSMHFDSWIQKKREAAE